jgi:hypothetical protein
MAVIAYLKSTVALYPDVISDVHIIANHHVFGRVNMCPPIEMHPLTTGGEPRHNPAIVLRFCALLKPLDNPAQTVNKAVEKE